MLHRFPKAYNYLSGLRIDIPPIYGRQSREICLVQNTTVDVDRTRCRPASPAMMPSDGQALFKTYFSFTAAAVVVVVALVGGGGGRK